MTAAGRLSGRGLLFFQPDNRTLANHSAARDDGREPFAGAGLIQQRALTFADYDAAIAEIARLRDRGYLQGGNWTLGQICDHLSFYYRGSLDGFGAKLPWLVRVTLGAMIKRRMLRTRAMRRGGVTAPQSVPKPGADEAARVAEAIHLLERLRGHSGGLHDSPLFGRVTPEEWRTLHLIHTAHHLGFLTPKPQS